NQEGVYPLDASDSVKAHRRDYFRITPCAFYESNVGFCYGFLDQTAPAVQPVHTCMGTGKVRPVSGRGGVEGERCSKQGGLLGGGELRANSPTSAPSCQGV